MDNGMCSPHSYLVGGAATVARERLAARNCMGRGIAGIPEKPTKELDTNEIVL